MFSRARGQRPLDSSQVSPHPHEVARVLNIITEILAASAQIIRRDEELEGNSCLIRTATLDRVSAFSEYLWEEIMSLPLPTIPSLHKPLEIYELILVDIQHILSLRGTAKILDDTIDHRLDVFLLQFQAALDLLKGTSGTCELERRSPNSTGSTHFFQNSHHMNISGGNFIATSSTTVTNPVVHDPVVREQSHKILQLR